MINLIVFLVYAPLFLFVLVKVKFNLQLSGKILLGSYFVAFGARAVSDGFYALSKEKIIKEIVFEIIQLSVTLAWSACIGSTYFFVMNVCILKEKLKA